MRLFLNKAFVSTYIPLHSEAYSRAFLKRGGSFESGSLILFSFFSHISLLLFFSQLLTADPSWRYIFPHTGKRHGFPQQGSNLTVKKVYNKWLKFKIFSDHFGDDIEQENLSLSLISRVTIYLSKLWITVISTLYQHIISQSSSLHLLLDIWTHFDTSVISFCLFASRSLFSNILPFTIVTTREL